MVTEAYISHYHGNPRYSDRKCVSFGSVNSRYSHLQTSSNATQFPWKCCLHELWVQKDLSIDVCLGGHHLVYHRSCSHLYHPLTYPSPMQEGTLQFWIWCNLYTDNTHRLSSTQKLKFQCSQNGRHNRGEIDNGWLHLRVVYPVLTNAATEHTIFKHKWNQCDHSVSSWLWGREITWLLSYHAELHGDIGLNPIQDVCHEVDYNRLIYILPATIRGGQCC